MGQAKNESRCENCIVRHLNSLKVLGREELSNISNSKKTRSVKKGESIFNEGDRLDGVYCVRSGVSKVTKAGTSGRDQILKLATKGELLGQRSMVVDEHSNLGAVALHDMELCFIPKSTMESSIDNNAKFMKAALKFMAAELKIADNVIADMVQKSVEQRLASALLYLKDQFGVDDEGYLSLILTREDIAGIVGTVKEVCIRKMAAFKKKGWIETSGKQIKVIDPQALYRLVEGL
ncbi:Crp/Fnr family transcriptional regulator [Nonlabens marinus]|uniref:Transcriptional regulator, Crp/Fnr family n=1 Tax=Nonlabens marinus S1-08 TaxID=1454201 RepID=W8VUC5_9FLAO|nr:Crp/Fnr family transcriptional regulator [Nonlabens marinus]BAO54478.1 transcriptional regulator, Crp/Fnr family [Nonlabens marinus S1-08]